MSELKATDKILFELNPDEKLIRKAIDEFGLTTDFREAGYILSNGKLLDLSGKRQGGTPFTRSLDHREICGAIDTGGKGISGTECMLFFERKNNIRFGMCGTDAKKPSINVSLATYQDPTEKQVKRLKESIMVCNRFGKCDLFWDIYFDDDSRCKSGSVEFPSPKDVGKIIMDLNACKLSK